MKKALFFIVSALISVSAWAANSGASRAIKLSDATMNGVSPTAVATNETPRLSQFEMPVLKSMKLSGTDIPDGIENGQRTGIRKAPLAATVKISGLVDASTIADNSAIELVGNANLFMDANKTFKCITGNYALTLSGGNILTLSNAGGYAIDALSVTISCPLVVQTSNVAVSAKSGITINSTVNASSTNTCIGTVNGTITINADVTATTSSSAAILNRGLENGGDIVINKGTVTAIGGNTGIWAYGIAAMGHITAEAGTVIHASGGTGIYAETGNIHLAGEVTANANGDGGSGVYAQAGEVSLSTISISSSGVGISAYNGLTLNGVTETNTADTGLGTVNGTLTINADVTATTAKSAAILSRGRDQGGDIIINSGTITAIGANSGRWAYGIAAGGNITAEAGTVIHASGGTGIYAETGNIHLAGEVTANANGDGGSGVYAQAGEVSLSTISISSSGVGISAYNGLTLNGVTETNTADTGLGTVNGTLTINADVTATTAKSAAILSRGRDQGGDIVINKGTVTAIGGNTGIWAYGIAAMGHITAKEGTVIHASGGTGICAETGNIHLAGEVTANANGDDGSGVYAMAGEVSLSTISISSSGVGISAYNGLTLNGVTETNTADTGLGTVNGTLTINADVTATTAKSAAILSRGRDQGGDIIINSGTITATGGNTGIWAYGIAAGGNITAKEGTIIHASGGTGIFAEKGNINLAGSVTATAKHSEGYGIYAKAGSATLSQVTVPQSFVAIGAANGLTLNGIVDAKSTNTCIGAYEGTLTINADVTATTTSSTAILNRNGDIIINSGNVTATGGTSGDWPFGIAALGNIDVKDGVVIAKGGSKGILAQNGTISITPPLIVITAAGGGISADGHTVVYDNGDPALRVVIMDPPVGGVVSLSSAPSPGNAVGFTLSGEIASAQTDNVWQISDDDVNWQDIVESPAGAPAHNGVHQQRRAVTTLTYTPKESEMGKYLRVKVAAAGHTGYIYSPSRQIAKKICTDVPVVPTLTNINDKVYLSNAKTTQEYIIFNYSKEASSLTASDWNNAVTPESEVGFFEFGGSSNANNTVFTRVKETPSTLVGEQIAEARIYIGTSVYMTDVELSVSKTVGYFQKINNELNCKVGDVIRCDASPVPSNATNWYGVSGSNWTVDFHNTGSQYGTFYEDAECTRPISSSTNYKTVYLKTLQEKNYLDVRILVYNSAIGYKTRYVQFNVTPDGYFPLLDYINGCSRTIAAGEKITGIEVSRRPFSGSVYGLTTEVSGEGTAPIVSFSLYETMTINAINATPGVYVYTPLQNGHPLNNNTTFTITVTDGKYAVDSLILRENTITADPNEELELVAQLMPSNSEAAITWTSSNPSVATVTNGIVTIAANAPIGAKATITATANGKSDECQITVSGEEYDLYVASTRVTSRNRDDILGDGKFAFDGMNTLEIKGNYNISNSANLVRNTGIDGLIIDVAQACTISQGSESYSTLFDLRKNTTIRGEQMTVNGNGVAFGTQGGMTLTLDSANLVVSAIMPFKGSGIVDDSMNIIKSRVEVNASGSAAIFSFTGGISLTDCYIQTPAGGEVVNGAIDDGKGSQVRNLLIVPSPEKADPALAFALSEATATINEAFVAPVLNNPNGLAVSYYSEDPMVATVNAETGEVTPVAAGTTTITAYTNGDLFHEAGEVSYTLTVLKGTVSLAFSAPTASVKVDATEFVLPILSNPQDVEVTYSSSNPAVATMFAFTGDVTLVAAGTTTITATFAGDEKYLPSEASYVLTVEPSGDPTAIEDVRFESDKAEKVLMDGILYIALPDGKIFDAHGLQVR